VVRRHLADRYELRYLTRRPSEVPSHVADLTDLDAITPAFRDIDAVVHLAASSSVEAPWSDILPNNIVATYNVFEAARRAGVELVVFASSNHVVGMYEVESAPAVYELEDRRAWDAGVPVRPDSLYGVSKVFGEALGRMYVDRYGLRVICLRIGGVLADDDPARPRAAGRPFEPLPELTSEQNAHRIRAVWLSHRDCAQLIGLALDSGRQWAVVYGISDNPRKLWDLESARELLGYTPLDAAPSEARG
jgi:nucleoside-diphosphate-sugar epimerase